MKLPVYRWVKAQFHAHSTRSDGRLEPEMVAEFYRRFGFKALSVTDHNKVTHVKHRELIAVPGIEVSAREEGVSGEYHIVIVGCSEPPPDTARSSAEKILEWSRDNDLYAFVAHPYWSMLSGGDLLKVRASYGVEIYNHGCEVEISRGYSGPHWDYALSRGVMLHGLAVDDAHAYNVDAAGGWVFLDLDDESPEGVLEALKEGRFYASSGIEVEYFQAEGGEVQLRCSGARVVKVLSGDTKGAYLSTSLIERLAESEGLPVEVEAWEEGFLVKAKDLRVEGRLSGGRIVELKLVGQLPVRGFYRIELIDGERAAWLNPVRA